MPNHEDNQTAEPNTNERRTARANVVEHALSMYAFSFCTLPAEGIYDVAVLAELASVIDTCHVYLIGYTPIINFISAQQLDRSLLMTFSVLEKEHVVTIDLPANLNLKQDGGLFYLVDGFGNKFMLDKIEALRRLNSQHNAVDFEVKYVGQAYGKAGSRNAIDRLLKHETLQKIALKRVPKGHQISLLLLAVQPSNQVFTTFSPDAENKSDSDSRISLGVDKLFNTSEAERVALYEAALIRYFYPDFNKEFKDSFPSTNLKILQDCYAKDFSAIIAEILIDELPFRLFSSAVKPLHHHIAKYDLHSSADRRSFFDI